MASGSGGLGYDPRLLYGIDLRAYKDVANVQYRPEKGIFQNHRTMHTGTRLAGLCAYGRNQQVRS